MCNKGMVKKNKRYWRHFTPVNTPQLAVILLLPHTMMAGITPLALQLIINDREKITKIYIPPYKARKKLSLLFYKLFLILAIIIFNDYPL